MELLHRFALVPATTKSSFSAYTQEREGEKALVFQYWQSEFFGVPFKKDLKLRK